MITLKKNFKFERRIFMKKMKKIASLVLAMMMALAMTIPVFAQTVTPAPDKKGEDNASITINNASKGATYRIYKIFNATYGDGNIAYTYSDTLPVNDYFEQNEDGSITKKKELSETDEGLQSFLNGIKGEAVAEVTGAEGTVLTFNELDYGYYLIESSVSNGAAITLDSTTPSAIVNDKNVGNPGWDPEDGKKIVKDDELLSVDSASYGDTVTFQLSVDTLNYGKEGNEYKQIKEYVITDNFDKQVFSDLQITKVTVGGTPVDTTGYTKKDTNSGFTLTIPWVDQNSTSLYDSNQKLVVTYTLKLGEDAVIASQGNVNTASLAWNYVNNGGSGKPSEETETVTATVYTYALAINKVDPSGAGLENAEFSLKKDNVDIKVTKNADGIYTYDLNATPSATLTSDSNGLIVVKGLAAGAYTIEETKAPAGYNKLKNPMTITPAIDETSQYTTKITYYKDESGKIVNTETSNKIDKTEQASVPVKSITVVNNAGTELPSTGGIGTTIFYIIGGILVVGAAVLLVTKKRMSKEA